MNKLFFRILILIGSLIILFDISEIIVRIIKPQITYSKAMEFSGSYLSSDPLLPFSLRKNYQGVMQGMYGEYSAPIRTNSLGYRGPEFPEKKPPGTTRILILGDSMTFGIGVSDNETYPSKTETILQRTHPNVEIINAGYADGFSPDSYYVYLKNRGLALDPDAIVVEFFVWNDITDLSETVWPVTDAGGLPEKVTSCCRIVDNGILRNKSIPLKYRYPLFRESHLFILLTSQVKPPAELVPKRDLLQGCILSVGCIYRFATEEQRTYSVIHAMKQLADSRGIPFSVVLFPVDMQLYPDAATKYGFLVAHPDPNDPEFIQKRIEEKLVSFGVPYLDLYPVFDSSRDRGYPFFKSDGHLNVGGNQIAAEAISAFLTDRLGFLH